MNYNEEKIKKFKEYIIEDYKRGLEVEDIAKVNQVKKTDGSFIQIGIRPLLDDDIFIDPAFSEYLPSAGRMIAVGEMDFLIKNILENKEVEVIEFKEDIIEFPKYRQSMNSIIIMSNKFTTVIPIRLMHRIDYDERYPRLDRMNRIVTIPERVLGNKIIILEKGAITWEKQVFDNGETLDILIKPAQAFGKVDITIRSVNKIKHLDPSLIKILEVKE
ncbi:hypothetical protein J4423_05720 [Candidatus Pacearchaeota archaeon]|nr:hypothetical protein [Candidatus Pacearchaeota archaeon]